MNHVKAIQELAEATQKAQAMTGAAIVAAIHTLAAAQAAAFEFDNIDELHTNDSGEVSSVG